MPVKTDGVCASLPANTAAAGQIEPDISANNRVVFMVRVWGFFYVRFSFPEAP